MLSGSSRYALRRSRGPASAATSTAEMVFSSSTIQVGEVATSSINPSLPPMGKKRRHSSNTTNITANENNSNAGNNAIVGNSEVLVGDPNNNNSNNEQNKIVFSQRLNPIRNSTINIKPLIAPQSNIEFGKLSVVLDVDETLIHSRLSSGQEDFRQDEERKENVNVVDEFTIELDDGEIVHVNKRPGLDKFLLEASQKYELFAYTAALEEYARPLLDWLDPHGKIFKHRLYRDSCLFMRGYYLKDLQKVNRPLNRCVLVDNNAFCFLPQLSNGVPISSFYDDPDDTALQVLLSFLDRIENEKDVRPFLKKNFNLETLLKDHREQIVG